ncbi:hypothetical protein ONE63_009079 [Megalurothrips usitatus]|uniref:Fatty acyl-CoA reductase n=1 Tax=Megalurothrips usitatus TaxID=439358 RepID=A0AAV7XL67_9NEOP|nr:hypothetical protein ONE63_009079 [Megalurothrips usitatus]
MFEPLLKERPEAVSKVRAVTGDCSELRLGLSASDEATLVDNVSYVFHAAATVRFDDPLKSAILLNTRGTREVVELCKKMKKLEVLEYVSTTYCFTNVPVLKEQPYPTDLDWRKMIQLAETEDQATLDAVSRKILDFQPNTYTFSKALAENIINDHRDDIPIIIYRPAVVISSMCEPFAGWLDNLNGPFGIWAGALKGLLRYSYGDPDVALSYTPVDWAIRGMIVCAVAKAARSQALSSTNPDQVDVVNMEGSQYEKLTYRTQNEDLKVLRYCAVQPLRYPGYHMTPCATYYWLGTLCSQVPYGIAMDLLLRLAGQKPRVVAINRKIVAANAALAYFMINEFPIETGKMNQLHFALHADDRPDFGMLLNDPNSHFVYVRLRLTRVSVAVIVIVTQSAFFFLTYCRTNGNTQKQLLKAPTSTCSMKKRH